jgi:hypothetical protein
MYNIEQYLYPQQPQYIELYNQHIEYGNAFIKNKKVLFLGLCRDVEDIIESNLSKISKLGEKFQEYKIILFENDSKDKTNSIIKNLAINNPNIHLISQTLNRQKYGPCQDKQRIIALAEYRNLLKKYAKEHYINYDYVIVIDTDFLDFSINGIINSFGYFATNSNIGAIAGNSFTMNPCFHNNKLSLWNYDSWAYREYWWNNWQIESFNELLNYDRMVWFGYYIPPVGLPPKQVNSAFGGACIYDSKYYFSNVDYGAFDCEHVCFHYNLYVNNPNFQLFINPSQIMLLKK